jgi:hypothetical protein
MERIEIRLKGNECLKRVRLYINGHDEYLTKKGMVNYLDPTRHMKSRREAIGVLKNQYNILEHRKNPPNALDVFICVKK